MWYPGDLGYLNAYIICHLTLIMFLHYLTLHKNRKVMLSSSQYLWVALKRTDLACKWLWVLTLTDPYSSKERCYNLGELCPEEVLVVARWIRLQFFRLPSYSCNYRRQDHCHRRRRSCGVWTVGSRRSRNGQSTTSRRHGEGNLATDQSSEPVWPGLVQVAPSLLSWTTVRAVARCRPKMTMMYRLRQIVGCRVQSLSVLHASHLTSWAAYASYVNWKWKTVYEHVEVMRDWSTVGRLLLLSA